MTTKMILREVVVVAVAAAIGNALQGWDNSNIAGTIMYIKEEFKLEKDPTVEGLIVAMSLIGGTTITIVSGPISDVVGRRPMLIASATLFFVSGLFMMWSPNVYVLLFARLLDGFGTGLAVTLVPVYISETAPSDMRGQLNTLPQFTGSAGMFVSYSMVFGMSLMASPKWRLMLGFISIPSLVFFFVALFYLPESPRWLVSKGRMVEAKHVLQRLRDSPDVTAELGLLVEGLATGRAETSLEEYIVDPTNGLVDNPIESWIAKPVTIRGGDGSLYGGTSNQGSPMANRSLPRKDPLVNLFDSLHDKHSNSGGGSMLLSPHNHLGSALNMDRSPSHPTTKPHWPDSPDAESVDSDDNNLRSPLLSIDRDSYAPSASESGSMMHMNIAAGETINSGAIGGGWQVAWKWSEKEGSLKRMYLHSVPASQQGSIVSVGGDRETTTKAKEMVHTAALVSESAINSKGGIGDEEAVTIQPKPNLVATSPNNWKALLKPGVKRALVVGMGLQFLQQASGINGVLYYAPQILEQAGVPLLLSNIGISSVSASLLMSTLTTFLMLPCIGVSIWLMDIAGRRSLLLWTIPILTLALTSLVMGNIIAMASILKATILTTSLVVYLCCFVMSFGVIPNILCAEIFPTHVRGLCIALCSLTYWLGNILITYSFPAMLNSIGLAGVFSIYVIACVVSWIFVFLKVPETKGMPLEVISEFFAIDVNKVAPVGG